MSQYPFLSASSSSGIQRDPVLYLSLSLSLPLLIPSLPFSYLMGNATLSSKPLTAETDKMPQMPLISSVSGPVLRIALQAPSPCP